MGWWNDDEERGCVVRVFCNGLLYRVVYGCFQNWAWCESGGMLMWLWWQEVRVVCCQCYGRLFVVRWFIILFLKGGQRSIRISMLVYSHLNGCRGGWVTVVLRCLVGNIDFSRQCNFRVALAKCCHTDGGSHLIRLLPPLPCVLGVCCPKRRGGS